MTDEIPKRRAMDKYDFDIEHLIADEEDPKQRVYLIVLNNLNNSLVANTSTIQMVSEKLDTHLTNFEQYTKDKDALLHQGKGAWKVMGWVFGIAQIFIGWGLLYAVGEFKALHATDIRIETTLAALVRREGPQKPTVPGVP